MSILTAVLLFLLTGGWVSGAAAAAPEAYVPLQPGLTWEFQQKIFDLKNRTLLAEAKAAKKNQAPVDLKGMKGFPQVYTFAPVGQGAPQETVSYIAQDQSGFFVFARKAGNQGEPQLLEEKFYILKFPLEKGNAWQQPAEGLLIKNTIEDTAATVQVPAGAFQNCILIKKLYFTGADNKTPVQEALFWFAPGVGSVKVHMKHFDENKEILLELVAFRK